MSGTVLTAEQMQAHNTFQQPEAVTLEPFADVAARGVNLQLVLPPKSIVAVRVLVA